MVNFKLIPATDSDLEFLDDLNSRCMRRHVEQIVPWDEEMFRQNFDKSLVRVVVVDESAAGMLKVKREANFLYLGDVMLAPEHRNKGLGTELIKFVEREASKFNLPLRLKVLRSNPAKVLYKRLGFKEIEHTEHYLIMEKGLGS